MENSDTLYSGARVTRAQKKRLMSVDSENVSSQPGTPTLKLASSMEKEVVTQSGRITRRNSMSNSISTPTKVKTNFRPETPDLNSPRRVLSRRRSLSIAENSPVSSKLGKEPQFDTLEEEPSGSNSPDIKKPSPSVERRVTRSQSITPPQKKTLKSKSESPQDQHQQSVRARRSVKSDERRSETKQNKSEEQSQDVETNQVKEFVGFDNDVEMIDLEQLDIERKEQKAKAEVQKEGASDDVEYQGESPSLMDVSIKQNVNPSASIPATDLSDKYDKSKSVAFNISESRDDTMRRTLPKTPALFKSKGNMLRESSTNHDSYSELMLNNCTENPQTEGENVKVIKQPNESLLADNSPYKLKSLKVMLCSTPVTEHLNQKKKQNESQVDISAVEISSDCNESKKCQSSIKSVADQSNIIEKDNSVGQVSTKEISANSQTSRQWKNVQSAGSRINTSAPANFIEKEFAKHNFEFSKSWSQSVRRKATSDNKIDPIEEKIIDKDDVENDTSQRSKDDSNAQTAKSELARQSNTESDGEQSKEFDCLYVEDEASVATENYRSGDSLGEEERLEMEMNEIVEDGESLGSEDTDEDDGSETSEKDSFIVSDPSESSRNVTDEKSVDLGFDLERERKISQQISEFITSDKNNSSRSKEGKKSLDIINRPFALEVSRMIDETVQHEDSFCDDHSKLSQKSTSKINEFNSSKQMQKSPKVDANINKLDDEEQNNDDDSNSSLSRNETHKTDSSLNVAARGDRNSTTKSRKRSTVIVTSSSEQDSDNNVSANSCRRNNGLKPLQLEEELGCESSDDVVPIKPPKAGVRGRVVPTSSDSEFEIVEQFNNSMKKNDIVFQAQNSNSNSIKDILKEGSKSKAAEISQEDADNKIEKLDIDNCVENETSQYKKISLQKSFLSSSLGSSEKQNASATKILHHSFSINLAPFKNPPPETIDHIQITKIHDSLETSVSKNDKNGQDKHNDSTKKHSESIDNYLKDTETNSNLIKDARFKNRHSFIVSEAIGKKSIDSQVPKRRSLNQTAIQSELSESFISHLSKERLEKPQKRAKNDENDKEVAVHSKENTEMNDNEKIIEEPSTSQKEKQKANDSNNNLPNASKQHNLDVTNSEKSNSKTESVDDNPLSSEDESGPNPGEDSQADFELESNMDTTQSDMKSKLESSSASLVSTVASEETFEKMFSEMTSSIESSELDSNEHLHCHHDKGVKNFEKKSDSDRNDAIMHALMVSTNLLLKSDERPRNHIARTSSRRLPLEFIEELVSAESEDQVEKKPLEVFETKLGKVEVFATTPPPKNSTFGHIHESSISPFANRDSPDTFLQEKPSRKRKRGIESGPSDAISVPQKAKPLEVIKSKLGLVKVYPTSPPLVKYTLGHIRESPITPHSTGFKVRTLNANQDTPPVFSSNKKSQKQKRKIEEQSYLLPKPKWITESSSENQGATSSSQLVKCVGATEFYVSSLGSKKFHKKGNPNKDTKKESANSAFGFKMSAVNKKDIPRVSSRKLLQQKERSAINSKY